MSDAPASQPIVSKIVKARSAAPLWILFVLSILVVAGLAIPKFGTISSPVQDRRYLGGYVAATALFGFSLSRLVRRRSLAGSLPFVPGVYVFPLDLVDARTRELGLYSLTELNSLEAVHHQRGGAYSHSILWFVFPTASFTFEAQGQERADHLVAKIQGARQIAMSAMQRGELYELAAIDPFAEARARNFEPAHDHGLLARDAPIWTRFIWAITILSGLVLGVAGWRVRNWQSDAWAYKKLVAQPDVRAAQIYVNGGGLRAGDVKSTIIPRAQLSSARAITDGQKKADALEQFLKDYPKSAIDQEARAALADAIHAQFTEQTTVAGLRAFIKRWPASPDVPAAKTKMRDLYRETLADFHAHANVSDKNVVPIVDAILAWADENEAPIDVRFRRRSSSTLPLTDRLLAKNLLDDDGVAARNGNAEISPVWSDLNTRESALVAGLQRSFRKVFPYDVVPLRVGQPLEDTPGKAALPLPDLTVPIFAVDYEVTWSGTTYLARDRSRRYLGLTVKMDVAVQVPKVDRVLSFALRAEPPDSLPIDDGDTKLSDGTRDDARIYDAMLLRAFESPPAASKLALVIFEPKTALARAPEL